MTVADRDHRPDRLRQVDRRGLARRAAGRRRDRRGRRRARHRRAGRRRRSTPIVERFGPEALAEDGTLDRARLGRIVFGDATALADLEAITGPPARARIMRAIEAAEPDGATGVVIEAIRLLDGGLATVCDEVWLVTCAPEVQVERLAGRGTDPEDAARRIEAQAGLVERVRPAATRVIDTSGSLERRGLTSRPRSMRRLDA